jgi:hypothetical protein
MSRSLAGDAKLNGYRFGRVRVKGSHGRSAFDRLNGRFRRLIEAIADAKLLRMRNELTLRGIRLDCSDEAWIPDSLRDRGKE